MDKKKVILLVCALLVAAVTAFMARSMFTGASAPQAKAVAKQPVPTGPKVLVATRALPVGTIITADAFSYQPWPKELVEEAYFIEGGERTPVEAEGKTEVKIEGETAQAVQPSLADLNGTVVRTAITAGQPITKGALVFPGDRGFLAAALGPGMRAVSVPVSALTGVAGFVFPGDRVDLMLTQNVSDDSPDQRPLKVAETIMRNIRVLATDQRVTPGKDKDGKTVVKKYKLVTLEATPAIAEKISVALSIGTISLSLRSLADNQAELEQALASGQLRYTGRRRSHSGKRESATISWRKRLYHRWSDFELPTWHLCSKAENCIATSRQRCARSKDYQQNSQRPNRTGFTGRQRPRSPVGEIRMTSFKKFKSGIAAVAIIAGVGSTASLALPGTAQAQSSKDARTLVLSIGRGQQINLPRNISDVTVTNQNVADVEVKTARQIYIHARGAGETTVYATDAAGKNVLVLTVRVGNNLDSLEQMFSVAMPEAAINITTLNGVAQPEDIAEAERLAEAFSQGSEVVSRLRTATPLQVNLQVRIAEVSRSLSKAINGNLATRDADGNGFVFGVNRGRDFVNIGDLDTSSLPQLDASATFGLPAGSISLPFNPATGQFVTGGTQFDFTNVTDGNVLQAAGRLFGLDVAAAFDLSERAGLATTLATPNLTTVSGETASFQAGGSFPIPTSSGLGATSVQFQDFGVLLEYTPTVLSDGRISLRVRPEVSDISSAGAVQINGFEIPAITTRTVETTVELGSGQSLMIAGLLQNSLQSSVDKTPGAGDLPIVGSLFRSNGWDKTETELVVVITPYLVKPTTADKIKLPTDGFNSPNDLERVLLNKNAGGNGPAERPKPSVAPSAANSPEFGAVSSASPALPAQARTAPTNTKSKSQASAPGFSFDN